MNQNNFINNSWSKFIEIKGKDSAFFLQGLITNDINKCTYENPIYSCLLSPQGKFLADFFISKLENQYLIEIHEKYFINFFNKLNLYKLRSEVELKENTDLKSYIILTKDKPKFIEKNYLFVDPRNSNIGYKIYVDKNSKILSKYDRLDYKNYKELLIKYLIPNSAYDLIENKSLLLENNFQNINAIDWNKGCYVGQELTARMKYRALLKKRLYSLEIISGQIEVDEKILLQKINIGQVISKSNKYIICMLKINAVEELAKNKNCLNINNSVILKFLQF